MALTVPKIRRDTSAAVVYARFGNKSAVELLVVVGTYGTVQALQVVYRCTFGSPPAPRDLAVCAWRIAP